LLGTGKKINLNVGINYMKKLIDKYNSGTIVEKFIYLNIAAFCFTFMVSSFGFLMQSESNFIMEWFAIPSEIETFATRPWSIITYGFLHGSFFHILSNLFVLFYIGNLFLEYFTERQFLSFYLYGTIFGGLLYLVSYSIFPAFENEQAILVGASAAVMAIFIGIATYIPQYELKIRFIGYIKLWKLALLFVLIDIIQIPNGNSGGHLAHLGGALFGYIYMKQLHKSRIYFSIKNPFGSVFKKNSKLKTVYKTTTKTRFKNDQQQIDLILDKISKSGYDSLTKEEKNLLFKQGKNKS
jgi:membrane associated rhomboid family serine protease